MTNRHQPGGQSSLANITRLYGTAIGPHEFEVNDDIFSLPVEIIIPFKLGLWLELVKVGAPGGGARLNFFIQLSNSEEVPLWFDLAESPNDFPSGFTVRGNDIPDEGLNVVIPYENPGGIQLLRIKIIVSGMTVTDHIDGNVFIGSLR